MTPFTGSSPSHPHDARPAVRLTTVPPAPGSMPGTAQHPEYVPSCRVSEEMPPSCLHSPLDPESPWVGWTLKTFTCLAGGPSCPPRKAWTKRPNVLHRPRWTQTTINGTSDPQEGRTPGAVQIALTFRWRKGPQGRGVAQSQVSRHLSSAHPGAPDWGLPQTPCRWSSQVSPQLPAHFVIFLQEQTSFQKNFRDMSCQSRKMASAGPSQSRSQMRLERAHPLKQCPLNSAPPSTPHHPEKGQPRPHCQCYVCALTFHRKSELREIYEIAWFEPQLPPVWKGGTKKEGRLPQAHMAQTGPRRATHSIRMGPQKQGRPEGGAPHPAAKIYCACYQNTKEATKWSELKRLTYRRTRYDVPHRALFKI